jgi:hypothetical protein
MLMSVFFSFIPDMNERKKNKQQDLRNKRGEKKGINESGRSFVV